MIKGTFGVNKKLREVVYYVKSHHEILAGKRNGSKLYITKISYDTVNLINATV